MHSGPVYARARSNLTHPYPKSQAASTTSRLRARMPHARLENTQIAPQDKANIDHMANTSIHQLADVGFSRHSVNRSKVRRRVNRGYTQACCGTIALWS